MWSMINLRWWHVDMSVSCLAAHWASSHFYPVHMGGCGEKIGTQGHFYPFYQHFLNLTHQDKGMNRPEVVST
jgi:hypothetical protein